MTRFAVMLCVLGLGVVGAVPGQAQSVGFEVGIAGVENGDGEPMFGVSGYLDLTERLTGSLSYLHWAGEDDTGFGNQGVNLVGLVRVLGRPNRFSGWLGAGVGLYELRSNPQPGVEIVEWEETVTLTAMLRQSFSRTLAAFFRGDLSTRFDRGDPDWGLFRVGLEASVF